MIENYVLAVMLGAALAFIAVQLHKLGAAIDAIRAEQAAQAKALHGYTDAVARLSVRKPRGRPPKDPAQRAKANAAAAANFRPNPQSELAQEFRAVRDMQPALAV